MNNYSNHTKKRWKTVHEAWEQFLLLDMTCSAKVARRSCKSPEVKFLKILKIFSISDSWSKNGNFGSKNGQNGAVFAANPFGICVLPVQNRSENERTDELTNGLTEYVTNGLTETKP